MNVTAPSAVHAGAYEGSRSIAAWICRIASAAMLPIPGTSSLAHLEENIASAELELDAADLDALSSLAA